MLPTLVFLPLEGAEALPLGGLPLGLKLYQSFGDSFLFDYTPDPPGRFPGVSFGGGFIGSVGDGVIEGEEFWGEGSLV